MIVELTFVNIVNRHLCCNKIDYSHKRSSIIAFLSTSLVLTVKTTINKFKKVASFNVNERRVEKSKSVKAKREQVEKKASIGGKF